MFKTVKYAIAVIAAIGLAACGGGGGGSTTAPTPTTFSQTYTASAAAGELITYSIDTAALTYSYTITKSSYGCDVPSATCHSGSGTLVKNSDGTFSPSTSLTSKVYALQNGMLVGSVVLPLNGINQRVPVLGVSNPITTTAGLAGDFNYMSLQCASKSYGTFSGCDTHQGTLTVTNSGTFTTCTGADITAPSHTCLSSSSGTLTSLGGGVWQFQQTTPTAGATTNYFLAFTAPNGQKVGVIDFNDATVYGYGHAVISTRVATVAADVAGNYAWANDYGQGGLVTLNSNMTTSAGATITQNSPWSGIATVSNGGYGMIAGNGVYVYRNQTIGSMPAYFEIGLKVN